MPRRWTPSDYIVHGLLCDEESLLAQLDRIRGASGALAAVLLVSRVGQFFGSMIRVAHREPALGEEIRDRLIGALRGRGSSRKVPMPTAPRSGTLRELLGQAPDPHRMIVSIFGERARASLLSHDAPSGESLAANEDAPASVLVVLIEPEESPGLSDRLAGELASLACMVNASPAVRTQRWNRVLRCVDRELDESELSIERKQDDAPIGRNGQPVDSVPSNEFEAFLRSSADLLLKVATRLTGSSIGHIYLARSDFSKELDLIALTRRPGETESSSRSLPIGEVNSVVSYAYSRTRAILINDIPSFCRTHPEIRYQRPPNTEADSYAELAVPITQSTSGGGPDKVIGVINVEKGPDDRGEYTFRDLQVLRHVALRFCLWRSRLQHLFFARSLADLTRAVGLGIEDGTPPTPPVAAGDEGIPIDFHRARPELQAALKVAYDLTRSHSLRLYLLSRNGRELIRFCDYPSGPDGSGGATTPRRPSKGRQIKVDSRPAYCKVSPELPAIPLAWWEESINAWVARSGRPCYVHDLHDQHALRNFPGLRAYLRTRDQTMSECCVPIFTSGRLVGTLNFQSEYEDVYREQRHLIQAIAEQLGLTLAHQRRRVEQRVFTTRSVLAHNTHELGKRLDWLRNLSRTCGDRLPPGLPEKIREMEELLNPKAMPEVPCPGQGCEGKPPCVGDVAGILRHAITASDKGSGLIRALDDPAVVYAGRCVAPDAAFPLCFILHEALTNCHREVIPVPRGRVEIRLGCNELGGKTYARFELNNPTNRLIDRHEVLHLYREPFRRHPDDRLHLGSFIAGSMLRAVGGDVSLETYERPGTPGYFVKTLIEVELSTAPEGADRGR